MKLKKVSRVLSLVVAGAMVLAMAPAAFAVNVGDFDYNVFDPTHHTVTFHNPNGQIEDWGIKSCTFDKDTGKCICGNACNHEGVQNVVDNGDGTHNVVCPTCNKVVDTAKHSYNENGQCACGATCNHVGVQNVVDNGDGTHNVVCSTCKKVLDTAEHVYENDGQCACGATCNHVGVQNVVDNGDGTHNIVCPTCGEVLGTANHVYGEDGKGTCACGAKFTCDHMGQHFKFVANNDGTHNVLCADCNAVVSKNVPCTYVDGKCQQCDAAQPAPVPTPAPGSSVGPVATTIGLGAWLLVLGGLILGFFGL